MATVADNLVTQGLRGMIGKSLVFKTTRGKTYVCLAAAKPDKSKQTEAQRKSRSRFREASAWAKEILLDSEMKAYYEQRARKLKLPNGYTAAVKEFMKCPVGKVPALVEGTVNGVVVKGGWTVPTEIHPQSIESGKENIEAPILIVEESPGSMRINTSCYAGRSRRASTNPKPLAASPIPH